MSTQHPPSVTLSPVLVGTVRNQIMRIPISLGEKDVETEVLIDSGAGGIFIHPKLAIRLRLEPIKLDRRIPVYNVDSTPNRKAFITHQVDVPFKIGGETRKVTVFIADIGKEQMIFGFPWLEDENPTIDWKDHTVKLRKRRGWAVTKAIFLEYRELKRVALRESILSVQRVEPNARLPEAKTTDAAGLDLTSAETNTVPPHSRKVIDTGIAIQVPDGTYGRVAPRSGLAVKNQIDVAAGVIDADYKGKVGVVLVNNSDKTFEVKPGDRIAQLIVEERRPVTIEEVPDLGETKRGKEGFGSTGINSVTEDEPERTLEDLLNDVQDDEVVISYIDGGPSIVQYMIPKTPLTTEDVPSLTIPMKSLNRYVRSTSGQYLYGRSIGKITTATELASTQKAKEPPKTFEEMVPSYLHEFKGVFDQTTAARLPEHTEYDHQINLKEGSKDIKAQVYPLNPRQRKELDTFVEENLSKGYIRRSNSPIASPFFFVGKKDGSLRPCQDYRALNEATIKDRYPLPLISDLMDKLKTAKVFTKMDLRAGYNNVRIREGDEHKAAFVVPGTDGKPPELYEPTVMFFGLCNSPATFQRMMNTLFADMLAEGWLVIYMDDILIFSQDKKTHQERTRRVLERLREHDLYLKPEKCLFDVTEVEFLGMIIRPGQFAMDPVKLQGIADWPTPNTVKQVRGFLGFGNFYRKFIDHFSEMARPMVELTRKDVKWHWDEEQENSFQQMKAKFLSAPVLQMPDETKPFAVECDASKAATGAVLRQRDANGEWHPCGYLSQSLNPAERNYEIYDRELLAIIRALEAWTQYLMGSPHATVVLSDHKNLTYWRTAQKLNRRQARWSLKLSEFDLRLVHVPGAQMAQSDALSRRPDHDDGSGDNDNTILLPDHLFVKALSIPDELTSTKDRDWVVQEALKAIKGDGPFPMKSSLSDWETEGDLVRFKGMTYVRANEDARREIVRQHHDLPSMGHPGIYKTTELVKRRYWWPGMSTFIRKYVEGCGICQQMKVDTHPTRVPPMPIPTDPDARPWSHITMDFITDLPESQGFDSVLVVVDHDLTKGVIFSPCRKTIDALGTAELLHADVYKWFGLPDRIISDRGPQFAAKVFQELCKKTGIKSTMSTAFHPQTDGETERVNQELEVYLRIFAGNHSADWTKFLADAQFAHNHREHSATKTSPFRALFGYDPKAIPHVARMSNMPAAQQRLDELQKIRDEAKAALELARRTMADRAKVKMPKFYLGQQVWLDARNLKLPYAHRKLAPRKEGPFKIKEVMGAATYKLALKKGWKIHPVFHAALLSPYRENDTHGPNHTRPPPDLIDGEEQYEVEAIINHRWSRKYRQTQYRVRWKGYESSEDEWKWAEDLEGSAGETLAEYKVLHNIDH